MLMERRDRQNLNLNKGTSTTCYSGTSGQSQGDGSVQTELFPSWRLRISLRAQKPNDVFTNLMKHINTDTLRESFKALDGTKALGVDRISKREYGKNLDSNLIDLCGRIHDGSYRPIPKREVLIPKANGKTRPIAIASIEDKIVDHLVGQILTQIYEPSFIRNSFGYRPNKSADGAIKACYQSLEKGLRPYVVEIDFTNFFNTIPHDKLISIVSEKIKERRFLDLIRRLLSGEILKSTGEITPGEVGTPQGGIASPILANIYLNEVLDQWFVKNYGSYNNIIVRYADDALFFFKDEKVAQDFLVSLDQRVSEYGLTLNKDKTHQVAFLKNSKTQFNFLGFTFYWGKQASRKILKVKTQKTKLIKSMQNFYEWCKETRNRLPLGDLWKLATAKIRGHVNYYGYWMNTLKINHFYYEAVKSLYKWLNRRSQKKSYTWEGFQERLKNMPLLAPLDEIRWKPLGWSFGNV